LSVRRQCALLGLTRSNVYYQPAATSTEDLRLMRRLDEQYTACPFYGSRRMTRRLIEQGEEVNRKRVQRLMRTMGLEAIYPKPRLSVAGRGHRIYPYLLRGMAIERPDQVWSADITYVPLASGFMYLAAVIDWFSRYVLAWRLSNTLDGSFCLEMLEEALGRGRPEVFNTDQGVQFTAQAWTGRLESARVAVSMDGKGRCLDNVFVERLWRTVKYEDIYLHGYETVPQLQQGLGRYFRFYNGERLHQALDYRTPAVFNTDQGVQFTAGAWAGRLEEAGVAVSMDGRGRCLDNVFVERLWRSVKYEDVYIRGYETVPELERGLAAYFRFYNTERPHQSLGYRTPAEVHAGRSEKTPKSS
jgi:putative transposase